MSRHGPMVLGICRRLLDDPHDVEDAFQATFLVLVKKAPGAPRPGPAGELALRGRPPGCDAVAAGSDSPTDRRERTRLAEDVVAAADDDDLGELRVELDAEVARLPARFRTPIVLCYFEGLTHDQAAERLRCPVGTVRSRMAKGRELLRSRLTRRGLAPTPGRPGRADDFRGRPSVPPALLAQTITIAMRVVAGRSLAAAVASTSVITLTQGVLRTMSLTRWMTFSAAVLASVASVWPPGSSALGRPIRKSKLSRRSQRPTPLGRPSRKPRKGSMRMSRSSRRPRHGSSNSTRTSWP